MAVRLVTVTWSREGLYKRILSNTPVTAMKP